MPVGHLYVFFGKMSIQILCPFFNWVGFVGAGGMLNCMSSLYILYINPLSAISFANIFSHSVDGVFILLIISFTVQKLFSLM